MNNIIFMTNFVLGRMRRIYYMSYPENRKDYKKSRICYSVGDTAAQTIIQLAGGMYLVTLMNALGISDGNMGIISSIATLAAAAQIISVKLSARLSKNKLFVCLTVLQKLWLGFIYFIPLMNISNSLKVVLMISCYSLAHISIQIGTPATVDWLASLIHSKLRGRYFAKKDSVAVFCTSSTTLLMALMLDFLSEENMNLAFVIIGSVLVLLALVNFIAFTLMKEPKESITDENGKEMHGALARRKKIEMYQNISQSTKFLKEFKIALQSADFRMMLALNFLWLTAFNVSCPFISSYQIKELSLSYTYIMALGFICTLGRVYLAPKAGVLADRVGMGKVTRWAMTSLGINLLLYVFTVPSNAYIMMIPNNIFGALAWTFISVGLLGIQLQLFDENKRIIQFSLFSVLSGAYGFTVAFLAGKLIDLLQSMDLQIFGMRVYAQQITNLLGVFFVILVVLFIRFKIEPRLNG
ncbi:MAG: MFS transporter [Lachnospiraceae bacterium]